jgi:hypothetical protein
MGACVDACMCKRVFPLTPGPQCGCGPHLDDASTSTPPTATTNAASTITACRDIVDVGNNHTPTHPHTHTRTHTCAHTPGGAGGAGGPRCRAPGQGTPGAHHTRPGGARHPAALPARCAGGGGGCAGLRPSVRLCVSVCVCVCVQCVYTANAWRQQPPCMDLSPTPQRLHSCVLHRVLYRVRAVCVCVCCVCRAAGGFDALGHAEIVVRLDRDALSRLQVWQRAGAACAWACLFACLSVCVPGCAALRCVSSRGAHCLPGMPRVRTPGTSPRACCAHPTTHTTRNAHDSSCAWTGTRVDAAKTLRPLPPTHYHTHNHAHTVACTRTQLRLDAHAVKWAILEAPKLKLKADSVHAVTDDTLTICTAATSRCVRACVCA